MRLYEAIHSNVRQQRIQIRITLLNELA